MNIIHKREGKREERKDEERQKMLKEDVSGTMNKVTGHSQQLIIPLIFMVYELINNVLIP